MNQQPIKAAKCNYHLTPIIYTSASIPPQIMNQQHKRKNLPPTPPRGANGKQQSSVTPSRGNHTKKKGKTIDDVGIFSAARQGHSEMNGLRHAEDLLVEDAELFHDEEYDEDYEDSEDFEALYDRHVHVQKLKDENPLEFPLMIPNEQLNQRALEELLPIHEAWSGVKLKGNNAYGL